MAFMWGFEHEKFLSTFSLPGRFFLIFLLSLILTPSLPILVLQLASRFLNFQTKFTQALAEDSFGVYYLHNLIYPLVIYLFFLKTVNRPWCGGGLKNAEDCVSTTTSQTESASFHFQVEDGLGVVSGTVPGGECVFEKDTGKWVVRAGEFTGLIMTLGFVGCWIVSVGVLFVGCHFLRKLPGLREVL